MAGGGAKGHIKNKTTRRSSEVTKERRVCSLLRGGAIKRGLNASGKGLLSVWLQSFRSLAASSAHRSSCQNAALRDVYGHNAA